MSTLLNRLTLLVSFAFSSLCLQAADKKPFGLMTDLIEHTGQTWQNGYASNLPVWQLEEAIEPLQYAAIRSSHPAFSWIVPGETGGTRQIAYRVIVADNREDAASGRGNLWDSGVVGSDRSVAVRYAGEALKPGKSYFWRVKTVTNTEGESEWSEVKAFRTADRLSEYETAYYPQVKTMEFPVGITEIRPGTRLVDFGKDAFGQLVLTLASDGTRDSVVVHLGECLEGGRILRDPGKSTIRYHRYPLALLKGTHTYRIKIGKDKRNTGSAAVLMPAYVGEVVPFRYCEIEGYEAPLSPASVVRETVHYPFDETASSFRCSNDTLNQIWELCKYSVRATSFSGIYVDGDRESANDLVQDCLLQALDNQEKFTYSKNLKGWMYTLMRNIFVNNYRRTVREMNLIDDSYSINQQHLIEDEDADRFEFTYDMKQLYRVIHSIPEEMKVPFQMFVAGFKYREIAEKLGLPMGTVKSRLFFIRKRLKEELKDFSS